MVRNLPANAGNARDTGLISGLGRYPGVGNRCALQHYCLENSMDRSLVGTVHGEAKSQTELSTHRSVCAHTHTHTERNGSSHGREQIEQSGSGERRPTVSSPGESPVPAVSRTGSTPWTRNEVAVMRPPWLCGFSWTVCYAGGTLSYGSAQPLSPVRLLATLWAAAHQASLSITNSRNLLKLTSTESVMPSHHLILCPMDRLYF